CRLLIEEWEAQHRISSNDSETEWWHEWAYPLQFLAFTIHKQQLSSVDRRQLLEILTQALQRDKRLDETGARQRAERFLGKLSLRSGLLQYDGNNNYSFLHRAFQEFLTARYIAEQGNQDQMIDRFMEHLHEEGWHEVCLLTIGY